MKTATTLILRSLSRSISSNFAFRRYSTLLITQSHNQESFNFDSVPITKLFSTESVSLAYQQAPKPRVPRQIQFHEVEKELSRPGTILIDVREKSELKKEGVISEEAKNIPSTQIEAAFQMEAEEFEKSYGFAKPDKSTSIIIHCKLGIRATKAAIALTRSDYINIKIYPGIVDWVENGGRLVL